MRTRFDCRRRRNPKISSSTSAPSLCTARTMFCGRRTLLGSVEEGERVGGQLVIWAQRGREHEVAEARGRRGRGAQTGSRDTCATAGAHKEGTSGATRTPGCMAVCEKSGVTLGTWSARSVWGERLSASCGYYSVQEMSTIEAATYR